MKTMKKVSVLMMVFIMAVGMLVPSAVFADDEVQKPTEKHSIYSYGVYEPTKTLLYESSRGLKITCPRVHVTDVFRADIQFSSPSWTSLKMDGVTYEPVIDNEAGTSTFTVPVELGTKLSFTANSSKMGDIDYVMTEAISLDKGNMKPVERKPYIDGFYTTTVQTKTKNFGWRDRTTYIQYGYLNPENDYEFPVTIEIKGGKIVNVAYTENPFDINANTGSDVNYLMWAMDGHYVTDKPDGNYDYLNAEGANYDLYNLDPHPAPMGTGLKDQIIAKNGTTGVDTVTAATITSRAIIDSVDLSLDKAELGLKDDPAPELPKPDTTPSVVPEDGDYLITAKCIGATLDSEIPIELSVSGGKMTVKLHMRQTKKAYPSLFPGTEAAALAEGAQWLSPTEYDYVNSTGATKKGSIYENVPIESLDKWQLIVCKSSSSTNWFNRPMFFDSKTLKTAATSNAEIKAANTTVNKILDIEDPLAEEDKIIAAREAYDNLAPYQRKEIFNYAALCELEADLANIKLAVSDGELEVAKQDLKDAKDELESAKQDLKDAKDQLNEALGNDKPEEDIGKLVAQVKQAKADVKTAKAEKDTAAAKVAELEVKAKQVQKVKAKAKKKKANVSWKSLGAGYKYEVYVSTKVGSGFKKKATAAKAKAVIKKLKSKKVYYFKVRGFKKVNGKTVYTAWSDVVQAKIK